jgi:hypothetical protein
MQLPVNYEECPIAMRKEVRNEYVKLQKGICLFCNEPLNSEPSESVRSKWINKKLFPKNFFKYPIHLHHNHDTGMTIGAIHCVCNAILWQYHGK